LVTIEGQGILVPSVIVQGQARVVSNFALTHFNAAVHFAKKVTEIEEANSNQPFGNYFEEVSIYCSSCIISAAASLEALINELYLAPGPLNSSVEDFDAFFWGGYVCEAYLVFFRKNKLKQGLERKPALEKYKKALSLLGKQPLKKNEELYKMAGSLIGYRNYLIHFKPLWDEDRKNESLEDSLRGLFDTAPNVDEGANFLAMQGMSAGCANWAVSSARDFILDFGQRSELFPKKFGAFQQ